MALVNKYKSKLLEEIKSFISKIIGSENTYVYTQLEKDTESIGKILNQLENLKFQNARLILPKGSGRHYKIESINVPKTAHANIRVRAAKNGMKKYEVWFMKVHDTALKGGTESVVEFDFIIAGENPVTSNFSPIVYEVKRPIDTFIPIPVQPQNKVVNSSEKIINSQGPIVYTKPCDIPKGYKCLKDGDKYVCTKIGGGSYESKYLKYKMKYLQLKNQYNL